MIQFAMKSTGYDSINSWGITVACSFINCLALIPLRVSGMLFVAFLSRYNADRQSAALSVLVNAVIADCSGPLIGYLAEIFALRNLIAVGCLLSSLGVGICYFAEDIITVTIFLGFLCGIGMSLQLYLLPQILKQHFTKNQATANGVTWIGSCVGGFIVIPIIKLLLDNYGVSGTLLMTCGIMLHGIPVAMLLRNPKYKNTPISLFGEELNAKGEEEKVFEEQNMFVIDSDRIEKTYTKYPVIKNNTTRLVEKGCLTSNVHITKEIGVRCTEQNAINYNEHSINGNRQPIANTQFHSAINLKNNIDIDHKHEQTSCNEIKQGSSSEHSPTTGKRNKYITALKALAILRNPPYFVIMLSMSAYAYIDAFVSAIIVDISRDKGIPHSQEQFFLMLIPVAQIVGYISLGWVTDKGYLSASRFQAIGLLCMGLSCCGFIFSNGFSPMMISVACFGLCISVYTSGSPSLVYDYVEESKQSMAIASRYVLHAPLCFTIGPILRYFRGTLGSYDGVLYLLAAFSITCSALLLLLPCIARCTNRRK